jgi:hypothetical protein
MGNVGYGNHEPPPVASRGEGADPKNASQKPGAGSQDRPGMDLGGAGRPVLRDGPDARLALEPRPKRAGSSFEAAGHQQPGADGCQYG